MLGTLQLERFRGFETYSLAGLTRVNLLVGKNNCGKTSILESIHFTSEGVLLGFCGAGRRAPLGSHGDGMRRLLALSLSLIQAAQGYLLVDEIDTGVHWTVMEDMWRLVVDTARKSSVQVFATTHSHDCIRGLAALTESRPDLAGEVSMHKIERALKKAVRFAEKDIPAIVDQNIEVR